MTYNVVLFCFTLTISLANTNRNYNATFSRKLYEPINGIDNTDENGNLFENRAIVNEEHARLGLEQLPEPSAELFFKQLADSLKLTNKKVKALETQNTLQIFTPKPPDVKNVFDYSKRTREEQLPDYGTAQQKLYRLDPVLNALKRRKGFRRSKNAEDSASSSDLDLRGTKEEFQEQWLHKKFEALNFSRPRGETVNMVAARPWGIACGDPNQADMPWGSCMLAAECEPELRIYRGDTFCGRTTFVCCAVHLTTYDNYQGFDQSFIDTDVETNSDERNARDMTSKEKRRQKKAREKRERRRDRKKHAKKLKKNIKDIIKEVKKVLTTSYRNATKLRKKRTKQLKDFVKNLKKQYKKDKQSLIDFHDNEMTIISRDLLLKLNQMRAVNSNFMNNQTFRDIVVNGTITKQGARMLLEAYPELESYLVESTRRSGRGLGAPIKPDDDLHYDVELGYVYY